MADDLNSLLQANRSSSVLQGIANPPQINPLAAMNSAVSAATGVYNLRGAQAQEALGGILQQATDANGTVDHARAQALAAQAGPIVQMGMAKYLQDNSTLRGAQQSQASAHTSFMGGLFGSLLYDSSDDNINRQADLAIQGGYPADKINEQRRLALSMRDPAQRKQWAYSGLLRSIGPAGTVTRELGTTTGESFGGDVGAATVIPGAPGRTPSISRGGGSIGLTLSPAEAAKDVPVTVTSEMQARAAERGITLQVGETRLIPFADIKADQGLSFLLPPAVRINIQQQAQGKGPPTRNPDGTVPSPTNPPRVRQLQVPTPPPPAPTAAPPAPAPAPAPAVAPAPAPRGVPTSSLDGMGGVQVASTNPLEAPALGPPSPPSPLVQGDVNALMQGMEGARNSPRLPGTQVAEGYTTGAGYDEQATAKLSQDRLMADSTASADYAKNILPYTQSLNMYGRGMTTGPGTEWFNGVKGRAGAVLRSMGFSGSFDSTKEYDELHKWLQQLVTSNPGAGRSDQNLAAVLAGNANVGIHELAGEDMVKVGAALMRMNAAVRSEWDTMNAAGRAKYGGYYANYLRDVNKTLDIRAFAEDLYNPHQAKTLYDDLKAHDKAYRDNYFRSLDIARRNGYASPVKAMP